MIKRKQFGIKRTKKRRKSGEITKLKAKLWQLCREIQIKKYGNSCYSCLVDGLSGSGLHLGHFITSSTCSTELRYDLSNLRPQCYRCNIHLSGNWVVFERELIAEGVDVEALKARNAATKGTVYPLSWFASKIEEYKNLLATQTPIE